LTSHPARYLRAESYSQPEPPDGEMQGLEGI